MHYLFKKQFPDSKVNYYYYYYTYFKQNFSLRFGRPQVDVCSKCEELGVKIKSSILAENVKRAAVCEKVLHINRANKFYSKLKEIENECKKNEFSYGIVIDFMQNLPLPHIPVQRCV